MPKKTLGFCGVILTIPADAAENLMINVRDEGNISIIDGICYQREADPRSYMNWKLQIWYDNHKHIPVGDMSYDATWFLVDNRTGFISYTFQTPSDLEDLKYFRFGLNGDELDTTVLFDIKDVLPGTTYTLQWRVLNTTQGEVAWTDMFLTHCGDGYKLPLGETNCEQLCPAGITQLYAGGGHYGLYANKAGTPSLCVQYNNTVCYGHLAAGAGDGVNIHINGSVYHLID